MAETPISELHIQQLDGEMYHDFKTYVEKHGGQWTPHYERSGQLHEVHVRFPPETMCGESIPAGNYDRRQITFKDGAILFWFVQRTTKRNSISVPYVYLS